MLQLAHAPSGMVNKHKTHSETYCSTVQVQTEHIQQKWSKKYSDAEILKGTLVYVNIYPACAVSAENSVISLQR